MNEKQLAEYMVDQLNRIHKHRTANRHRVDGDTYNVMCGNEEGALDMAKDVLFFLDSRYIVRYTKKDGSNDLYYELYDKEKGEVVG